MALTIGGQVGGNMSFTGDVISSEGDINNLNMKSTGNISQTESEKIDEIKKIFESNTDLNNTIKELVQKLNEKPSDSGNIITQLTSLLGGKFTELLTGWLGKLIS